MNKKSRVERDSAAVRAAEPRIYEVSDFVNPTPANDYVLVRHYRTVYHPGGQISKELISSTETLLEQMIHAFHGQVYQSAGTLNGFFDDPERARECARAIALYHHKEAEVIGTQVTIAV